MTDTAILENGSAERGAPEEAAGGRKKLPFPVVHGRERGYKREQVEEFFARARAAFEGSAVGDEELTADDVRGAGFVLVPHGFSVEAVDQALGRIEEAFASRERRRALDSVGPEAWVAQAREEAQEILEHLARPRRRRFERTSGFSRGYDPDEVDAVADRVAAFLSSGEPLEAEQVRQAAFRSVRRGYREEQVDALLDATVRVMLAVR